MKRLRLVLMILLFLITLMGCIEEDEKDLVPPNIVGVKNIDYRIGSELPDFMEGVSAYDNIDGNITQMILVNDDDIDYATPGVYSLIYSVLDSSGNPDTKSVSFTVIAGLDPIDLNPPTIINFEDIFYNFGDDTPNYVEGLTAFDLEDGYITEHITYDDQDVDLTTLGTYDLIYSVEDEARNSFSVTVLVYVIDPEDPMIFGLDDMDYYMGDDLPDFRLGVTATDNYDGDLSEDIIIDELDFDPLVPGTYQISYEVTDSSGNTYQAYRNISVLINQEPVIDHPGTYRLDVGSTAPNYLFSVTATDDLDGDLTLDIEVDASQVNLNQIGTYTVTYMVKDSSEQITTLVVEVSVVDQILPVISGTEDINYYTSDPIPNLLEGVYANDNYDGDLTSFIEVLDDTIDFNVPGTYELIYQVLDSSLNLEVVTQTLTVTDNVAPIISGASDITYMIGDSINLLDGLTAMDVTDGNLTEMIVFDDQEVNYEVVGTYIVTYSVLDSSGNLQNVSVELSVIDPLIPSLSYLNVYYLNDTHGSIEPNGDEMGLAQIGNLIADEKANNPDETLFIGGGDLLQGSLLSNYFYGSSMLHILKELDMDAFVIGNHEFDWGIDVLTSYRMVEHPVLTIDFPLLGANIFLDNTTNRPYNVDAYTIIEKQNVKVGIIGLIGYGIESSIATSRVEDYYFGDPIYWAGYYTEYLRNEEDVDVVLVVLHDDGQNGFNQTLSTWTGSKRVDAVFNGHSHQSYTVNYTRSGASMPAIQSSSNGKQVGKVSFTFDYQGDITAASASNLTSYNETRLSQVNTNIQTIIDAYKLEVEPLLNDTIIVSGSYVSKSDLTYYMAKLMRVATDSDIGFHNSGGTRDYISDDEAITVAKLYKIFPFDNRIKTSYILGSEIKDYINSYGSYNDIRPGLSTFLDNTYYKVATNDYIFDKVDNPFIYGNDVIDTGILIRDILETVMRNQAELGLTFMVSNPINL